jgi:hypothetical protein
LSRDTAGRGREREFREPTCCQALVEYEALVGIVDESLVAAWNYGTKPDPHIDITTAMDDMGVLEHFTGVLVHDG